MTGARKVVVAGAGLAGLAAADELRTRHLRPRPVDNQHLSFHGGPHYCFGALLARLEARIMLGEWLRRVENPRLAAGPVEYRPNPTLRGPLHLVVDHDRIAPT